MDDDALRDIEKGHSGSAVIEEGEVAHFPMKVSLFSLEDKILVWCRGHCLLPWTRQRLIIVH